MFNVIKKINEQYKKNIYIYILFINKKKSMEF